RLIRAMRTLVVESRMCLGELETTYDDLGVQVREHGELLQAIREGTLEPAQELLNEHMDDAVRRLVTKRVPPAS
ncbi:MAG TPA: FCD domain-containing protein, partial [Ruania sp.]|nr:FCD domain-containing protein [Ruania sp.]